MKEWCLVNIQFTVAATDSSRAERKREGQRQKWTLGQWNVVTARGCSRTKSRKGLVVPTATSVQKGDERRSNCTSKVWKWRCINMSTDYRELEATLEQKERQNNMTEINTSARPK